MTYGQNIKKFRRKQRRDARKLVGGKRKKK